MQKAITAAIDRIGSVQPQLASHLQVSIQTGNLCAYLPSADDAPTWILD